MAYVTVFTVSIKEKLLGIIQYVPTDVNQIRESNIFKNRPLHFPAVLGYRDFLERTQGPCKNAELAEICKY